MSDTFDYKRDFLNLLLNHGFALRRSGRSVIVNDEEFLECYGSENAHSLTNPNLSQGLMGSHVNK